MNDWFSFGQSPWELALGKLRAGETIPAVRLLALLEGEEEEAVEEAFEILEAQKVTLDIGQLPQDFGTGETEKRLRLEQKLAASGELLTGFPEGDPLRLCLEELAAVPVCGDPVLLAQVLAQAEGARAEAIQKQLVDLSLSRVVQLAGEFTGYGVLLLDLVQEGSMGLWNGILQLTPEQDFETMRDWWIRQYMARAVTLQARASGVGQKMRNALEAYRTADRQLLTQLGRNPTVEEIALEMGVSAEDAQVYEDMLRTAQTLARAKAPEEAPEAEEQAVEDTAYFQSRQRIAELLSTLTEQETRVVVLRFGLEGGLPCTAEETAAKLGMTARQVVDTEAAALGKLRRENEEK